MRFRSKITDHKLPGSENSYFFLTKEKGLSVLNLKFKMLPLTVNSVILEHIGLHKQKHIVNIQI